MYRALRRRIVQQLLTTLQPGDRSRVDDGAARLHPRDGGARHIEIPENIRLESAFELFVGQIFNLILMFLKRGVIHKHVDRPKRIDGRLYRAIAKR